MVIVSGMYQLYDGKKTYFWKAQQLTQHDHDNPEALNEAFLYVVSGVEDRQDSAQALRELEMATLAAGLPEEEAQRMLFMYQAYNKVFFLSSTSPERASDGLYVTTKPRLGLAAAEHELLARRS
jgi:hypothetical protein